MLLKKGISTRTLSAAFILAVFLITVPVVRAQEPQYNHPELHWRTIKTEHFAIHYHKGTEWTARRTAVICEEIYGPITSLYGYAPKGRVHIIVRDHDDNSNGAAFYYDDKIELWAPPMDFPLRGTHRWLPNVISHEFSHMISLGAARKFGQRFPALYLQWMGYEKEKRPDVLHGYPNRLVSFPLAGTVVPMWLAEGMAQLQRLSFDFERWDAQRDMVLRTQSLSGSILSLDEMSVFGKTSLGNESVYDHGYGLTLYIAHKYGEAAVARLARALSRPLRSGFSGACREVLGIDPERLHQDWCDWLRAHYRRAAEEIRNHLVEGQPLPGGGEANYWPVFSPDGGTIAYLSSEGEDYMSRQRLCLLDLATGKRRPLEKGVTSPASWSPAGDSLVYAKKTDATIQGSHFYDLYIHDRTNGRGKRVTASLRARQPDWSPNGKEIVFIVESDGTSNLAVIRPNGQGFRRLTSFMAGEQLFRPRWSRDGSRIIFSMAGKRHGRDIAVVNADGADFHYLIHTEADERDPVPLPDGSGLLFASDRSGIFNLYIWHERDGSLELVTNLLGGAFQPAVRRDGDIVFSRFGSEGFRLARIVHPIPLDTAAAAYKGPYDFLKNRRIESPLVGVTRDSIVSTPYRTAFSKLSFLPRIMLDYPGRLKLGTYFYGSDRLDRISLLGGVAANSLFDTDLYLDFEYRRLWPTLFLEAFQQRRHTSQPDADYIFQLMEVDLGANWPLGDSDVLRTAYVFSRYNAVMKFEDQGYSFAINYTYHLGNVMQVAWRHRSLPPSLLANVAPRRGERFTLLLEAASNRFIKGFKLNENYGTLVEDYDTYRFFSAQLDWRFYLPGLAREHSLAARVKAGYISREVDSFYNLFGGGLDGMRGYPYYSIEGRRLLQAEIAYRFPLARFRNTRVGIFNLDRIFLSLHAGAGNAWNSSTLDLGQWKKDVGLELRSTIFSFYSYPLSIFLDAAYGLDRFSHSDQIYGREARFYFGILFGFLD